MWESKNAPLAGVVFAALLIAAFLVYPNTEFMPEQADVVAHFEDGPVRAMVGAYLGSLAAVALIWFAGAAHRSLRRLDDDEGRLATLALVGGAVAATLLIMGEVATIAAAERVWVRGTIDAGAAASLFDIAGIAIGNGVPLGLAVLIGSWAVTTLRSGTGRGTAWISLVIALGLVSPYGWIALFAGLLWVAITGVALYRTDRLTTPAAVA